MPFFFLGADAAGFPSSLVLSADRTSSLDEEISISEAFSLPAPDEGEDRFTFFVLADPQLGMTADNKDFRQETGNLKKAITATGRVRCHPRSRTFSHHVKRSKNSDVSPDKGNQSR